MSHDGSPVPAANGEEAGGPSAAALLLSLGPRREALLGGAQLAAAAPPPLQTPAERQLKDAVALRAMTWAARRGVAHRDAAYVALCARVVGL